MVMNSINTTAKMSSFVTSAERSPNNLKKQLTYNTDSQQKQWTYSLGTVRQAVESRLQQSFSKDNEVSLISQNDAKMQNFGSKLNFLVKRSKERNRSLEQQHRANHRITSQDRMMQETDISQVEVEDASSIPIRISLKETSQERILKAHNTYAQQWTKQVS